MSMSRLHTAQSAGSPMSDAGRTCVDARKFDFSAVLTEPTPSSVPVCFSGPVTCDALQPACDRVKFTTGHSMEFLMPDITSGGTVEKKPLVTDVDSMVGRTDISMPKPEDWISKNLDRKFENAEMMTKLMKDEVMTSDSDTKISSATVSASHGNAGVEVSTELKPDLDKPYTAGDVVAASNVTSSSTCSVPAAASSTATTGGTEVMAIASASDLKKESQAINYDWVGGQFIHHIHYH